MSFHINNQQQITIYDSYMNQTPRTQKMIQNSWCKDFADIVFPAIDEQRFSVLYSGNSASRPNTPVNVIIGALILKENGGLSDDELLEAICCDVRYQYALHTTHMLEQPVSDRTFSRFRERLYNYEVESGRDLLKEEMEHLAAVYADYMKLNTNIKRMDSLMIASRCKRMSRLEIIYTATANAIKLIHRLGYDELITADLQHYMNQDDYNQVIYYCKGEEVTTRLTKAIQDYRVRLKKDAERHERKAAKKHAEKYRENASRPASERIPMRKKYQVPRLPNGETRAELLHRSRYLLYKSPGDWTVSQRQRARIEGLAVPHARGAAGHRRRRRREYGLGSSAFRRAGAERVDSAGGHHLPPV